MHSKTPSISRRDFLRLAMMASGGLLASCSQLTLTPPAKPAPGYESFPPTPANLGGKIDTVIVVLQENHSFDNLFASYPGANGKPAANVCPAALPHDIPHDHEATASYPCSYTEEQIPNYWQLARHFTLCDQYFGDLRGPSFPNYLMLTTAQSAVITNPLPSDECPPVCQDVLALPNRLDDRGLTWHDYGGLLTGIQSLAHRAEISRKTIDGFYQAAAAGTLQNVVWIATYLIGGSAASGHPPANICEAENFAINIINAAMSSPQWPSMALFLVWDEWGGFYDHVEPPVIERLPDGTPFRYGYRVPCLVISPRVRPGFVSHTLYSHVSILKTIEIIFDLPPLTERDAQANSLLDCFDFSRAPLVPFSLFPRQCSS